MEARFSTVLFHISYLWWILHLANDWQMKFNNPIEYPLIFKKMAFKITRSGHALILIFFLYKSGNLAYKSSLFRWFLTFSEKFSVKLPQVHKNSRDSSKNLRDSCSWSPVLVTGPGHRSWSPVLVTGPKVLNNNRKWNFYMKIQWNLN